MVIIKFVGSTPGRWVRGIVGVALLILGALLGGFWWILRRGRSDRRGGRHPGFAACWRPSPASLSPGRSSGRRRSATDPQRGGSGSPLA